MIEYCQVGITNLGLWLYSHKQLSSTASPSLWYGSPKLILWVVAEKCSDVPSSLGITCIHNVQQRKAINESCNYIYIYIYIIIITIIIIIIIAKSYGFV